MEDLDSTVFKGGPFYLNLLARKLALKEKIPAETLKERHREQTEDIKLSNKMHLRPSGLPQGTKQTQIYQKM